MFNKLSFQIRMFIVFSLIISLLLSASGIIFLQYHMVSLKDNIGETSLDALLSVQSRIDNQYSQMSDTLKSLHASKDFNALISNIEEEDPNTDYFVTHPLESNNLQLLFTSYLSTANASTSLCYVTKYYDFYQSRWTSRRGAAPSKSSLRSDSHINDGLSTSDYQIIYPPHASNYFSDNRMVYSVLRPIRSTYETYGVLVYQSDLSTLEEIIFQSSLTDLYDFSLYSEHDQFLYSFCDKKETPYDAQIQDLLSSNMESGFFYANDHTLVCYATSPFTGWKYVAVRDLSSVLLENQKFIRLIVSLYAIVFCFLLLFLYIITYSLTKPLKTLKCNLEKVEKNPGELPTLRSAPDKTSNEVAVLASAIEDILQKIHQQSIQIQNAKESAVKAHLISMEAQLNPHFLYNTLSVIGAYGMESGNAVIMKMCSELSQLLRYTINYTSKTVPIENEFNNVKSYLYIMQMRYESQLKYSITIDDSMKSVHVPKLILQPIVENCFQHGFKDFPDIWQLEIKGWCDDTHWHVCIRNNGHPFKQSRLLELTQRLDALKEEIKNISFSDLHEPRMGIGLENTVLRLHLYYLGNELFEVSTDDPAWTTIELGGPIYEKSDDHYSC